MRDRNAQFIGLDQRKGRAGDLQPVVIGKRPKEGACQGRLAGPEITRERDAVAGLQGQRQIFAELDRCRLVRQEALDRRHHSAATIAGTSAEGMRQVTSVPSPSLLRMETVPWCRLTKLSTIERPRPAPPRWP
ncbi:hypothetical protein D9M72_554200 [compost metagenome]